MYLYILDHNCVMYMIYRKMPAFFVYTCYFVFLPWHVHAAFGIKGVLKRNIPGEPIHSSNLEGIQHWKAFRRIHFLAFPLHCGFEPLELPVGAISRSKNKPATERLVVASKALISELSEEDPRVWKGDEGNYAPSFTPASSDTESYGAWHDVFSQSLESGTRESWELLEFRFWPRIVFQNGWEAQKLWRSWPKALVFLFVCFFFGWWWFLFALTDLVLERIKSGLQIWPII